MTTKKKEPKVEAAAVQAPPTEQVWAAELEFLRTWDAGPRPPSWKLTPRAVVTFIVGSKGEALKQAGTGAMIIAEKFVGDRAIVERCVVTLAGERGLLLVGEPGTEVGQRQRPQRQRQRGLVRTPPPANTAPVCQRSQGPAR